MQYCKLAFYVVGILFVFMSAGMAEQSTVRVQESTPPVSTSSVKLAPGSTGCTASCNYGGGTNTLTCSASGPGSSCKKLSTNKVVCKQGRSTTTCICATNGGCTTRP